MMPKLPEVGWFVYDESGLMLSASEEAAVERLLLAYGKAIAPTVDLTQAANKIAAAYGVDPDELAALSNTIWNASTTPGTLWDVSLGLKALNGKRKVLYQVT